ncbi:MAG: hypothetical protein V3T54_06030, partial [Acidobacteriota bacterium]
MSRTPGTEPIPPMSIDFDSILEKIAADLPVEPSALLPHLCREDRQERCRVNFRLAKEYAGVGEFKPARALVQRAWLLSGFSPDILPLFIEIHSALGDFPEIQAAYKRLGMRKADDNDFDEAFRHFQSSFNTYSRHQKTDRYQFDFDILDRIERMANPYAFRQPKRFFASASRKPRIAYLTHLLANPTSVFSRINHSLAEYHDRSAFTVGFFLPEPASAFRGTGTVDGLRDLGYHTVTAPEGGKRWEKMIWLGAKIRKFQPDLLVTHAAFADPETYFLTCLRPAPLTVGLVYGPPPQFTTPGLDWCIASARHPLMDTPNHCSLVEVEPALPDRTDHQALDRARFDLPAGGPVLLSAGRSEKFQDAGFWEWIRKALDSHPAAHFVAVGILEEQIPFLAGRLPP